MKKTTIALFFVLTVFLNGGTTANAKTSFEVLIPTATMRDPQVEAKDLDSCFLGAITSVSNFVSGSSGTSESGSGCSLDSLARIVGQQVAGTQFQSMMNMTGQGFFGDTSFLTDPNSYYRDINTEITQNFLKDFDTNKPNMLDSVKTVKSRVLQNQYTPYQNVLDRGADFPGGQGGMDKFLQNWDSCPTGNGWDCYKALGETKNDPFLSEYVVSDELAKKQKEGLTQASNEISAGKGYFSLKDEQSCAQDPSDPTKRGKWVGCSITTPGSNIEDQTNKYLSSSLEQIGNADELDETIIATMGGLFGAVTGWLTAKSLIKTVQPPPATQVNITNTNVGCGTSKNSCSGIVANKTVVASNPDVTISGYTWNCSTTLCRSDFPIRGTCGSFSTAFKGNFSYSCSSGRVEYLPDSTTSHLWICRGSDDSTEFDDSLNCSLPITVKATCGIKKNTCSNGWIPTALIDGIHWICKTPGEEQTLYCPQ